MNGNFNSLGFIIGVFIAAWIISIVVYHYKRYDDLETTIESDRSRPR